MHDLAIGQRYYYPNDGITITITDIDEDRGRVEVDDDIAPEWTSIDDLLDEFEQEGVQALSCTCGQGEATDASEHAETCPKYAPF